VVGGFTDWCQISAGSYHSAAVRRNGTVWSWGGGFAGKLGDNSTVNKSSPVSVVGGFTDWVQVSTSVNGDHSLGVRANGTAWAWGFATAGQLGTNSVGTRCSPELVVGGFNNWAQVSAGGNHSLGLRANGTAWAWGSGGSGRLGDNTTTAKSSPVSVVGGFTNWCQISAGATHSMGLRQNGTLWAWGSSASGALGDGNITSQSSPVSVIGIYTDWQQVTAGDALTLAVRANKGF
jgi:alpha-tubulin suppressor-like RCC1 family protein